MPPTGFSAHGSVRRPYSNSASTNGRLRAGFFLDLLRRGFSAEDARHQLDTAIDWGRYAELFDYDTGTDQITAPAA